MRKADFLLKLPVAVPDACSEDLDDDSPVEDILGFVVAQCAARTAKTACLGQIAELEWPDGDVGKDVTQKALREIDALREATSAQLGEAAQGYDVVVADLQALERSL